MAKTAKQLQEELINDGTLDRLAESNVNFASLKQLPVTKQLIILSAASFIERIQENLKRLGKVSTGRLEDGITQGDLIEDNVGYEVDLGYEKNGPGAKYYDYVNKGVRGKDNEAKAPGSPYGFTNKMPPLLPIISWLNKNRKAARNDLKSMANGATLTGLQKKRESIKKMVDETTRYKTLAFLIARKIQRQGLEKTGFFDEAVDFSFGKGFIDAISKTVGADIKVYIRQANLLINEKNNR